MGLNRTVLEVNKVDITITPIRICSLHRLRVLKESISGMILIQVADSWLPCTSR